MGVTIVGTKASPSWVHCRFILCFSPYHFSITYETNFTALRRFPDAFHKFSTGVNSLFLSTLMHFCTNAGAFGMGLQKHNSPVCGKTGILPPVVPTLVTPIYAIVFASLFSLICTAGREA